MSSEKYETYLDEYRVYHDKLKDVVKNKLPRLTGGKLLILLFFYYCIDIVFKITLLVLTHSV